MGCAKGQFELFYELSYSIFFTLRVYASDMQLVGGEVSRVFFEVNQSLGLLMLALVFK